MNQLKQLSKLLLYPRVQYRRMFGDGEDGGKDGEPEAYVTTGGQRLSFRDFLLNPALLLGGLIVFGLFAIVLFGPLIAPINPYIGGQHVVSHYDSEKGVWVHPPLEPSQDYPLGTDEWGNDILSMLLYGARNTLVLCAFITMVRIVLGLVIGAYAGWNEGKPGDQVVMGVIGVLTAIPMLISSMIIIYALDIRRGLPVFIIALSIIGWTEIAQYIRSEFLVIRKTPYIEGAYAVGARNFTIAVRHVLPNILPKLLVITFLEIGAVLILLGELGFVGVYIGGGSHIATGDEITGINVVTLSEVPEWGAMLAEGYRWLRAKPFVVFPPAIAFFIAVLGFNSFGEGLRRLMEKRYVNTSFLLKKRMLLVVALITFGTVFIINNTGPAPWFNKLAQSFDSQVAYGHARDLSAMDGRGTGQAGGNQAAVYIAETFQAYGLQPGWKQGSYTYPLTTRLVYPNSQPRLALVDTTEGVVHEYRHQIDFGYMIEGHAGSGQIEFPVTFLGFDQEDESIDWESYKGLDLRDQIVLLVEGNAPENIIDEIIIRGGRGILLVVGNSRDDIRSQIQLADPVREYLAEPSLPVFRIRPEVADQILSQNGSNLPDLFNSRTGIQQRGDGWYTKLVDAIVQMEVSFNDPEEVTIPIVLGYRLGSDYELANQMVVLFANYDGLGIDPDGTIFVGANHNASGIGILLEVARLWKEQNLEPRRSVLFVAWGGEGLSDPAAQAFINSANSFRHLPSPRSNPPLSPQILFQLDYAGAGGDDIFIHPYSSERLAELVETTADEMEISITDENAGELSDIQILRVERGNSIYLSWQQELALPTADTFDTIDAVKLQELGQILSRTITQIVRQANF